MRMSSLCSATSCYDFQCRIRPPFIILGLFASYSFRHVLSCRRSTSGKLVWLSWTSTMMIQRNSYLGNGRTIGLIYAYAPKIMIHREWWSLWKSTVENTTQEDFDLLTCCIGFGILHAKTMVIDGNLVPRPGKCILHTSSECKSKFKQWMKIQRRKRERKASVTRPFFITAHL